MKKGRIISALLSIFMMLVSNTLRADNVISQFRILGGELSNSAATSVSDIDEVLPRKKFLAWHYACYVEHLAQAARRIHDIPLM